MTLSGCISDSSDGADESDNSAGNNAPSISGDPAGEIVVMSSYEFTPSASDLDGDTLQFSIQNKPRWMAFDINTGAVTGTPEISDVGEYPDIRISVSDGMNSAQLPPFYVAVTAVGQLSITLSWAAPTTNENGSVLSDLNGYEINYGMAQNNLDTRVPIDNASMSTFVVDGLSPIRYFFCVRAVNSQGALSNCSNTIQVDLSEM